MSAPPKWPPLDCPDCVDGKLRLQQNPWNRRGWIYLCERRNLGCRGLMSAHPDGEPMGTPANQHTRNARKMLHELFDPLWKDAPQHYEIRECEHARRCRAADRIRRTARVRAYGWLANQLGIHIDDCHISMFDLFRCRAAWTVVQRFRVEHGHIAPQVIRDWAKAREGA